MAPAIKIADSLTGISGGFRRPQNIREGSWEFTGSEHQSDESRDVSEELTSYHDEGLKYGNNHGTSPTLLEAPESYEDVLHPLREAANRVGNEVERFAEALDGYNPLKALDDAGRYEMTFDLIDMYYNIALETVKRLRDQHATERRKQCGVGCSENMRGSKISQDPEAMETDDIEDPGTLSSTYLSTTIEDLKRWEEEAQTWDLLRRMIKLKHPLPGSKDLMNEPSKPIHQYSSEHQVWTAFLESDTLALERNTILGWLRDTADKSREDIDVVVHDLQQNAERGDIITHGWLHTKAAIKNQKRIRVWPQVLDPSSPDIQKVHFNSSKTEPLVTQLDPDAPTRQNRSLEIQDQYFERAIWLGCYEMLRRGKSTRDVREWCRDRTEIWRAISMSALPGADIEDSNNIPDHVSSALWRRMCFALAKRGDIDEYERAVYGILSGDVSTVEPVCRSWDDHIFVHYNALVRSQFENYLSVHCPSRASKEVLQGFGVFNALQFHGDPETAGERLVNSLKLVPQLKTEIMRPMKMLQGVLIAKKFENFIYHQGLWLSKLANADKESNIIPKLNVDPENKDTTAYIDIKDHDSLRVLVHMFLILKTFNINLEQPVKRLATENVVVAYIDFLRLAGKEELIPLYSSQLTGNRVYATLSRELVDVTDPIQRETQIRLIRDLGLDVQQFVRYQTRFLFQDFPDDSVRYPADEKFKLLEDGLPLEEVGRRVRRNFIGNDIDRIDMLLIRSLEWHLLVDGLWSETFYTGTLLYKRFFKQLKLAAARKLTLSVSSSDISRSKTRSLLGETLDLISLEADDEDEDITGQLNGPAEQTRLLKRHMLAEAKTFRDLEHLIIVLDSLEIASISVDSLRNSNDQSRKDCRANLYIALQPVKVNVIALFQDWLLTSQKEDPELTLLREAYLPEIILAYDCILSFSGLALSRDNLLECMDLSTIIAAEESDLADLFLRRGRMAELVTTFAENSKTLLYANKVGNGKTGGTSKKLRTLGWTRELWDIKL